ncbi:glycosyltransferase [Fervidibacter sacchari]|uniref:Glycosyltransferase involved in cell wall biosynthesis/predicted deacetylase n=1 Tax=Candidatus Fervidibacter sacchari TaxID=1448929 RepID=A0ABT2ENQ1_9BACT|nr:glycosyltransferase [Candidatus Fervidibacter sacchari]MCS3918535.1 glycosyltransferase involved in cell wall biosynthesis/predicted deacetylase [Candidatus Fervidibacter sacchari]WKU17701.1 glycosyltransferase [Candidatus Fervidibacter sacchari]
MNPKVLVLFRNDDLCAWSDPKREERLLRLFDNYSVPMTIGVVPKVRGWRLDENRAILNLLEKAKANGHELALHGLEHDHHEFERLPLNEAVKRLNEGQNLMKSWFGKTTKTFIPPDNAWVAELLQILPDVGISVVSSGPPLLPLPEDFHSIAGCFVVDAATRFLFAPFMKLLPKLAQMPMPHPIPVVVYFHSWEVKHPVHWERMERLLRLVKETDGVEAMTFREAVERYPEAIKYWLSWRDETRTQRWNEMFYNWRFHRVRMLHRYWRDLTDKSVDWLEDWLANAYCAALMGDIEGMEVTLNERSKLLLGGGNPLSIVRWLPIFANAAVRKLNHRPPTKMEDAFQVLTSPIAANIAVNSQSLTTPHASRSLIYLSFDRNIVSEHAAMSSKALAKRGWKVTLVHPSSANPNADLEGVFRVEVGSRDSKRSGKSKFGKVKGWLQWGEQKEMARLIATWRPTVIYARQHWLGLLPLLTAKRLGIPYVAEFNGLRHRGILSRNPRSVKGLIIRQLERWCVKWSTAIVVPSLSLAKRVAELLGNKPVIQNLSPFTHHASRITHQTIFIIPNGIDPEIFRPIPQEEARRKLGLPTDGLYVVYAGSLHVWQGVDVLLHAFAQLVNKFPNCRLLIVGGQDEPNKDAYKRLAHELRITDYAHFIPFVPYEQSALYIAAADVCVAPYVPIVCEIGGGSPLKLYAYLSCGRPVVLSDLGEFVDADLVRNNGAGILVPPADPEALAEAIAQLLNDPTLRSEMGKRGREAILNGYTWDHNAERIEKVLESVMRNS